MCTPLENGAFGAHTSAERSCPGAALTLASGRGALAAHHLSRARVLVTQPREQYCTLGLVVLGGISSSSALTRAPSSLLTGPGSLLAVQPISSGQKLHSRALFPSRLCSQSCPVHSCPPAGSRPGPPSPGSLHTSRSVGTVPAVRGCRLQQPWQRSDHSGATGDKYKSRRAAFCSAGPKMPGTVASEHITLCNRHKFFQRSSTAGIYRAESNF